MSDQDPGGIQDAVTRSLRTMLLGQIKETPTGDVYKLELFDWYVKETETLLSKFYGNASAGCNRASSSGYA